jgi:hypothetical protein
VRESFGGTWITGLVISFMLIFVAFLALSLNYTKAFQLKNEMLTIIEKYEGVNDTSLNIINNYLKNNGYSITGKCSKDSYGVTSLDSTTAEKVTSDSKVYSYCVTKELATNGNFKTAHYTVNIYFYFNLPIIGDIFKFNISGTTNNIANPQDSLDSI